MASELKGIVAAFIVLLVHSTGALAESEDELLISWKGVNGLSSNSYSDPNVTSDCANFFICNNVDNYPTELARWALEEYRKKFNVVRYTMEKKEDESNSHIVKLCPSQEEIMYPTAALSTDEEWYFILNLPENSFQGYYVNKCDNISSSCRGVSTQSKCEQGYTYRRMIYLDLKKQIVSSKKAFKLPSCCSCAVYF